MLYAGHLLQQLLPQLSHPWPPSLLKQLLCAVVTECPNSSTAAAGLVQCITSAAATAAAAAAVPSAQSLPASEYQIQWSSALTQQILAELQEVSFGCSSANPSSAGSSSKLDRTATLGDYIGSKIGATGKDGLAKLFESTSGAIKGAGGTSSSSSSTRLTNMMVMNVTQEGVPSSISAVEPSATLSQHEVVAEGTTASSYDNSQAGSSTDGAVQPRCPASGDQGVSLNLPCQVRFTTAAGSMPQQQLLVGDLVRLAPQQAPLELLSTPCCYIQGRVAEADNLGITISLPWTPVDLRNKMWQIGKLGNVVTFERCMTGLECMASSWVSAGAALQVPSAIAAAAAAAAPGTTSKLPGPGDNVLQHIIISSWYKQQQQQQPGDATHQVQTMHPICSNAGSSASSTASSSDQSGDVLTVLRAAGKEPVMASGADYWSMESDALNQAQQAAAVAAVTQRLTLIWGPPGTGKVGL